jgi:hypothetical protein
MDGWMWDVNYAACRREGIRPTRRCVSLHRLGRVSLPPPEKRASSKSLNERRMEHGGAHGLYTAVAAWYFDGRLSWSFQRRRARVIGERGQNKGIRSGGVGVGAAGHFDWGPSLAVGTAGMAAFISFVFFYFFETKKKRDRKRDLGRY